MSLSRRKFLLSIGALSAALPFKASAFDLQSFFENSNDFNFILFGDIHFDKMEYHNLDYVRKRFSADDIRQQEEYSKITRENLPELIKVAKEWAKKTDAKFFLQLGDVVEGLSGSKDLATNQANGLINFLDQEKLPTPFIVLKGNHDVTGIGAQEMYLDTIVPWQNKEMEHERLNWQSLQVQESLKLANKTFVFNNARFILYDCFNPESLAWLSEILKSHNKEQQLFFCTHVPVVPYDDRSSWHIFAHDSGKRKVLLNLLGEYKAIVLSAHLHKFSIVERDTSKGPFVQVGIGSVMYSLSAPMQNHLSGLKDYDESLVRLEPNFSPSTLQLRKDILTKEKPFIRYYEYADFCGYAIVRITSKKVGLSMFVHASKTPWKTFDLTNLTNSSNV